MASTFLNLLHEALSPGQPYCLLPPLVYLELGFGSWSAVCTRLVVQLDRPMTDPLVENFVMLCTGERQFNGRCLSFKDSPVDKLDQLHGVVTLGEVLPAVGFRNGRAATDSGLVHVKLSDKPEEVPPGTVVMLPQDMNLHEFSSVFYITTQKQTIYDGEVIGHLKEGLGELDSLLRQFGTQIGQPKTSVIVQQCGRI